ATHICTCRVSAPAARDPPQTVPRRRRKSASLAACRHAAHEYAIVLRVDHGGPVAQQRSFADHARIVRQNCDSSLRILIQKTEYKLVNQRCFAGATGTSEADDFCIAEY